MKWIKKYNESLESVDSAPDKEVLMDICLDLKDEGYYVSEIDQYWGDRNNKWGANDSRNLYFFFALKATNETGRRVLINNVKDTLGRIKNYLGENFHHFTIVDYRGNKWNISLMHELESFSSVPNICIIYVWYLLK